MKVKSIFDKHYLLFLLAVDPELHDQKSAQTMAALSELLKSNITWPETYLLKNMDVGFANAALSSITELAKAAVAARGGDKP
jgi:hypothetical protein